MSDNNDFNGSEYMRLKVELEREEAALATKRAQLERLRREERERVVYEVRQKIILHGLLPRELYPAEKERALPRVANPEPRPPPRDGGPQQKLPAGLRGARFDGRTGNGTKPVRYTWQGNTWSGFGRRPRWFDAAIAAGITLQQMADESAGIAAAAATPEASAASTSNGAAHPT